MPRKNPIAIIKDTAFETLKDPRGAAGKAVEQAKGTAAIGRMVAGQLTRTAAEKAAGTVGAVTGLAGRTGSKSDSPSSTGTTLRPVPPVNEPGHTTPPEEPGRVQGDPLVPHTATEEAKRAAEAPAKKAAKTAPAAKKAPAAKEAPAKKAAESDGGDVPEVTPADVAKKVAKKAPAKKTPAKTAQSPADAGGPGDRLPPRKESAPSKQTASKKAAKTAQEVRDLEGSDVTTPVGTTGADQATNPDTAETDLQQPGTEPLLDPATAKAARSEAETMQKAADPDKG